MANIVPLRLGQYRRSTHGLPLGLCTRDTCLRSFNQQVAFEFGYGIQHLHRHSACGTGQVDAAEREAMNPDAAICQSLNGCTHVHRISAKSVELRHDQHIAIFHLKK
ncbi:hypothetical protein X945_5442 [Burkholderia pseudomallei ABCPW 107]|nr:hypothetical protein X945_5442 [Burkholderia pseudomallei ABCPW 107]